MMTGVNAIHGQSDEALCSADGTPLRAAERPKPKYEPLKALHHFRILLKDKENTAEVFKIFDALPSNDFMRRVRTLALSEQGENLRARERSLPALLDDHEALRKLPKGSVAHAYCDFMEREGLSAAGLVEESEKSGRPTYMTWFSGTDFACATRMI